VSINLLLSTIILVSFLITIVMAVGSYVAYKLREARRPQLDVPVAEGESPYFERITANEP
jgi:heme/copper-type cytochrome/quinol oxidase subunit 2